MRNEERYHRLSMAEYEELYGEGAEDFHYEREKSLYQLECEAAGIPY